MQPLIEEIKQLLKRQLGEMAPEKRRGIQDLAAFLDAGPVAVLTDANLDNCARHLAQLFLEMKEMKEGKR